jgi:chaperonin GroEL
MAKQLLFDDQARLKAYNGIKQLAQTVCVTLGPSGRNVLLEKKFGSNVATKDGVTVSKEIELPDPFENIGAKLANEAADKANDVAGDGTTTAVILTESIFSAGLKALAAGVDASALKRGIDAAVEAVLKALKEMSVPVGRDEDYRRIALISSHYDEPIADMVMKAIAKVGKEGVVTLEESKGLTTELEFVDGMQFDKGYISPYFINKAENLTTELEDVSLLLTDKKISSIQEFVPILERVAQAGVPLLVIAEEVEGEALAALVINKLRGILRAAAVKAPAFGDRRKAILQDIAILTGGRVVSDDLGLKLESLTLNDLGRAGRVTIEKEKTTIIGGKGSKKDVQARVDELRTLISRTTSDYDKEKLEERLAKLSGGVAVVKVGGATEAEMKERKFRVEDAVNAAKAAAQEGYVAGGGVALLRCLPALEKLKLDVDEQAGAKAVARALEAPLFHIARNAGHDAAYVVHRVKEARGNEGFDAVTGEFVDLVKQGVIDPTKVAMCAFRNAASVASMLLTSRTLIAELKEKKKAVEGAVK